MIDIDKSGVGRTLRGIKGYVMLGLELKLTATEFRPYVDQLVFERKRVAVSNGVDHEQGLLDLGILKEQLLSATTNGRGKIR